MLRGGLPYLGGSGSGGGWLPSDAASATLVRWFESDHGVTVETGVSLWEDRSGNANLSQATEADQPLVGSGTFGALDSVDGDGSSDHLDMTELVDADAFTVAVVIELPNTTSTQYILGRGDFLSYIRALSGGTLNADFGGSGNISSSGALSASTTLRLVISRNSSDEVTCRLNGSDVSAAGPPTLSGSLQISRTHQTGGSAGSVKIGAIIMYSGALSGAEVSLLETYLERYS